MVEGTAERAEGLVFVKVDNSGFICRAVRSQNSFKNRDC